MNVLNKYNDEVLKRDTSDQYILIKNPNYDIQTEDNQNFKCRDKKTGNVYKTLAKEVILQGKYFKTGALKVQKEGCTDFNDVYKSSCDQFFKQTQYSDQSYKNIQQIENKFQEKSKLEKQYEIVKNSPDLSKCIDQRIKYTEDCVCVGDKGHYEYIKMLEKLRESYLEYLESCSKTSNFNINNLDSYLKYDNPYTELKVDMFCKIYMLDSFGNVKPRKNYIQLFLTKDPQKVANQVFFMMIKEYKNNYNNKVVYLKDLYKDSSLIKNLNRYLLDRILEFPDDKISNIVKDLHTDFMKNINFLIQEISVKYTDKYGYFSLSGDTLISEVCKLKESSEYCEEIYTLFNIQKKPVTSVKWSKKSKFSKIYDLIRYISYYVLAKIKLNLKNVLHM